MKNSLEKITKDKKVLIFAGKICPYCGSKTVLVDSKVVYKISYGMIHYCEPCKAWVGVHPGTTDALGRLANSELREAKKMAHFYFDKLWREKIERGIKKGKARGKAYAWLSKQLNIPAAETHIGWFDVDMCKRVVEICKPHVERLKI